MSGPWEIKCNLQTLLLLSEICLNPDYNTNHVECVDDSIDQSVNDFMGAVCIFNSVVGGLGNLLTLVAVPWAAHRRKYT